MWIKSCIFIADLWICLWSAQANPPVRHVSLYGSVRRDEYGGIWKSIANTGEHYLGSSIIQSLCRLIQKKERGLSQQGARQHQAPGLAA